MVPLMLSIIGIPMRKASGTSLIAVMILAIPGVIEQGIIGNINYLAGIAIVIGTIPGAVIGARLVTKVPERTLRLLFGCFLIVAAVMLVRTSRHLRVIVYTYRKLTIGERDDGRNGHAG